MGVGVPIVVKQCLRSPGCMSSIAAFAHVHCVHLLLWLAIIMAFMCVHMLHCWIVCSFDCC